MHLIMNIFEILPMALVVGGGLEAALFASSGAAAAETMGLSVLAASGAATGGYLSNELGIKGAGKTAIEVGGGALNTVLGVVAASNLYNPIGWLAAGALGFEALAIGVNELVHAQNSEKIKSGIHV